MLHITLHYQILIFKLSVCLLAALTNKTIISLSQQLANVNFKLNDVSSNC